MDVIISQCGLTFYVVVVVVVVVTLIAGITLQDHLHGYLRLHSLVRH